VLRSTAYAWPPHLLLRASDATAGCRKIVIPLARTATTRTNPAYNSYVSLISHDKRIFRDAPSTSVIGKREACIEPMASYSVAAFVIHENSLDLRYCGAQISCLGSMFTIQNPTLGSWKRYKGRRQYRIAEIHSVQTASP
jgi:hypothetical protein